MIQLAEGLLHQSSWMNQPRAIEKKTAMIPEGLRQDAQKV
ncbi:hypothetical protein TNCV_2271571, partial [Trichonephila clavipes]